MIETIDAWVRKRAGAIGAVYDNHKVEVITVFVLGMTLGDVLRISAYSLLVFVFLIFLLSLVLSLFDDKQKS